MGIEKAGFQDYEQYGQEHEFTHIGGVVQLPVASRTADHRLIRLHGGYGKRTVRWKAKRNGRPPVIPVASGLTDDTLLNATVMPMLPRPNENAGGFDWCVSGTYEYAQNAPRIVGTDAFPVGGFPFALPIQEAVAGQLGQTQSPSQNFSTYYNAVGASIVDPVTGAYIWPFLALPTAFTSEGLI